MKRRIKCTPFIALVETEKHLFAILHGDSKNYQRAARIVPAELNGIKYVHIN